MEFDGNIQNTSWKLIIIYSIKPIVIQQNADKLKSIIRSMD